MSNLGPPFAENGRGGLENKGVEGYAVAPCTGAWIETTGSSVFNVTDFVGECDAILRSPKKSMVVDFVFNREYLEII
jgi:hypothetical protein